VTASNRNTSLLVLALLLSGLAVVTVLPWSGPRTNDLGYTSLCPFAPWSTLLLLAGAGLVWAIRQYLDEQARRDQVKS
jgi:Mg2+/citrate symporter